MRKEEKNWERERSFLNANSFLSFPVSANFDQRTSLVATVWQRPTKCCFTAAIAELQLPDGCQNCWAMPDGYHTNSTANRLDRTRYLDIC